MFGSQRRIKTGRKYYPIKLFSVADDSSFCLRNLSFSTFFEALVLVLLISNLESVFGQHFLRNDSFGSYHFVYKSIHFLDHHLGLRFCKQILRRLKFLIFNFVFFIFKISCHRTEVHFT